jgi:hypothetical protein
MAVHSSFHEHIIALIFLGLLAIFPLYLWLHICCVRPEHCPNSKDEFYEAIEK